MMDNPKRILRLEAAVFLLVLLYVYNIFGEWLLFALLFFVPDLSMLGYLINKRWGAIMYNLAHNTAIPMMLIFMAWFQHSNFAWYVMICCMVWLAHILFDRVLGYGLKYEDGFAHTHLKMLGEGKK